jgi:hypothetical protein
VHWYEAAPRFPFEVDLRTGRPPGLKNAAMFKTCQLESGRGFIPREVGFPSVGSGLKHLHRVKQFSSSVKS